MSKTEKFPYVLTVYNKKFEKFVGSVSFLTDVALEPIIVKFSSEIQIKLVNAIFNKYQTRINLTPGNAEEFSVGLSRISKVEGLNRKTLEKDILGTTIESFVEDVKAEVTDQQMPF